MPSQMRAISLENEIIVAMKAFDVYLIISAVRVVVRMTGVSLNIAYIRRQDVGAAVVDAADHDAVRVHEVLDGHAFGQELRVHAEAEVDAGLLAGGPLELLAHHRVGGARARPCS